METATEYKWKISVRAGFDRRMHSFYVNASDEAKAVAIWIAGQVGDRRFKVENIVRVQRADLIRTR